jgi:hypothetical protein
VSWNQLAAMGTCRICEHEWPRGTVYSTFDPTAALAALALHSSIHLPRAGALSRMLERGARSIAMIFRAIVFTFLPTALELAGAGCGQWAARQGRPCPEATVAAAIDSGSRSASCRHSNMFGHCVWHSAGLRNACAHLPACLPACAVQLFA